jgi:hypothetical protein
LNKFIAAILIYMKYNEITWTLRKGNPS